MGMDAVAPPVDVERVAQAPPRVDPSFEDLVAARFRMVSAEGGRGDAKAVYDEALARFGSSHGRIIHEAWSTTMPGGAVVTAGRRNRLRAFLGAPEPIRLHSFMDNATKSDPLALMAVARVDEIASLCGELLSGSTQRLAVGRLHAVLRQVLAAADSRAQPGGDRVADDALLRLRFEVDEASALMRVASQQSAQLFYFWGMVLGFFLVGIAGGLGAFAIPRLVQGIWDVKVDRYETAVCFGALAAGALGAQISIMWRMSTGSSRDADALGPEHLRRLGAFRPFIGAIFGLILYFALKAGLVSKTYVPQRASARLS